ncbi:MAG: DUF86 domain-containing protein [Chitinophagales bacterium]|nr:DUF86 domain-containing protein [Chitinophagales bacterium]
MSDRPVKIILQDILESISKIEKYTVGLSFQEFSSTDLIIDAVERNIEIIGEACNQIPDAFILKHNEVEWHKPISMRNRLIHGYFSVDIILLWNTITVILPDFKIQIISLIQTLK